MEAKNLLKFLAPYAATFLAAIGIYADYQTKLSLLEYRVERIESTQTALESDMIAIKNLLFNIDNKLNVVATKLEERTGK